MGLSTADTQGGCLVAFGGTEDGTWEEVMAGKAVRDREGWFFCLDNSLPYMASVEVNCAHEGTCKVPHGA